MCNATLTNLYCYPYMCDHTQGAPTRSLSMLSRTSIMHTLAHLLTLDVEQDPPAPPSVTQNGAEEQGRGGEQGKVPIYE